MPFNVWGPVEDGLYGAGSGLQQFATGVGQGVKELICRTYRNYPGWAMGPKLLTAFGRGFMDSACKLPNGQPPTPRPSAQFPGGQCECIAYNWSCTVDRYSDKALTNYVDTINVVGSGGSGITGRIESFRITTGEEYRSSTKGVIAVKARGGVPGECLASPYTFYRSGPDSNLYYYKNLRNISVARQDGQSDNCGSLTPVIDPTPPPEGDKYYDINVPITIGPNTFSIPISLGPISIPISPEFNFQPVFIIPIGEPGDRPQDRQPVIVTPDGVQTDLSEVYRRLQENLLQAQQNNKDIQATKTKVDEVKADLVCVKDSVCVEIEYSLEVNTCDSEQALVLGNAAYGLNIIANLANDLDIANELRINAICRALAEESPAQENRTLIDDGEFVVDSLPIYVGPIPPGCKSVDLVVFGYSEKFVQLLKRRQQNYQEGKFGAAAIAFQVSAGNWFVSPTEFVYLNNTRFSVPPTTFPTYLFLSLAPSCRWQLYDTGER